MTITKILKILIFIIFYNQICIAKNLHYDPAEVTLDGQITLENFKDPNGLKSKALILNLENPINVVPTHNQNEPPDVDFEYNILKLQLASNEKTRKLLNEKIGQKVKLYGKLYHQYNGFHWTKVLMEVLKIE